MSVCVYVGKIEHYDLNLALDRLIRTAKDHGMTLYYYGKDKIIKKICQKLQKFRIT
jgi:hypothetical protein